MLWRFGHFITALGQESKKGKLSEELEPFSHVNKRTDWHKSKRDGAFPSHMGNTEDSFQTDGSGSRSLRIQVCPHIKQIISFNYRFNLATEYRFMFCFSKICYNAYNVFNQFNLDTNVDICVQLITGIQDVDIFR